MMKTKIIDFAEKHDMLPQGAKVLCCVSGGADSMALLTALCELEKELGITVEACHYNHRLRGNDSDRDEEFVRSFCEHIPLHIGSGDVSLMAKGRNLEETARRLRYEFFENTADKTGASRIATAHTADDNIETVLMNLTRGSALRGLGGIPPVRGRIIRPMLTVSRSEIISFLDERGISHVEDLTNYDEAYTRNRIRHQIVPILRDLNPRIAETISNSTAMVRADNDYLDSLARDAICCAVYEPGKISLPAPLLLSLPYPLALRAARLLLKALNAGELSFAHLYSLLELCSSCDPSASLSLHGITARRVYSTLELVSTCDEPMEFEPVSLNYNGITRIAGINRNFSCKEINNFVEINNSLNTFCVKRDIILGKLMVRPRKSNDTLSPLGRNWTKSLKKLFVDEKIPRLKRNSIPVIADEAGVVAVPGFGLDKKYAAKPGDNTLFISVTSEDVE